MPWSRRRWRSAWTFPTGVAMGACWNEDLMRRMGAALAREGRAKGNDIGLKDTLTLK